MTEDIMGETPSAYWQIRDRDRAVALACGFSEESLNRRPEIVDDVARGKVAVPLVPERIVAILEKTASRLLTHRAYEFNPKRTRELPPLPVELAVLMDNCWPGDVPKIMERIEAEAEHIVCLAGALDPKRSYPHLAHLEEYGLGLDAVVKALKKLRPAVAETEATRHELRTGDSEGMGPTDDEQVIADSRFGAETRIVGSVISCRR